jgi:hypothetical protein
MIRLPFTKNQFKWFWLIFIPLITVILTSHNVIFIVLIIPSALIWIIQIVEWNLDDKINIGFKKNNV